MSIRTQQDFVSDIQKVMSTGKYQNKNEAVKGVLQYAESKGVSYQGVNTKALLGNIQNNFKKEKTLKPSFTERAGSLVPDYIKDIGGGLKEIGGEINTGLKEFGSDIRKIQTGRTDEAQGLLGRTAQNFGEAQEGIKDARISQEMGNQSAGTSMLQSMGLLGLATADTIGDTFISTLQTLAPEETEQAVMTGIQKLAETEGGQYVAEQLQKAQEGYEYLQQTDPDKARNYKALFGALSVAGEALGIGTVKRTGTAFKEGIDATTESVIRGTQDFQKASTENVNKVVGNLKEVIDEKSIDLGETLESGQQKIESIRNKAAGLDERDIFALENTPKEEWTEVIEQAKDARLSPEADYKQTPYHIGAKKANDAFVELENNIAKNQETRVQLLENSGIEKIDTAEVRSDIVQDIRKTFNLDTVTTGEGGVQFNPVEGRKVLLDETNKRDLEVLKLLEESTRVQSPLEMMDTIKKMQNIIYDSNMLNSTSKGMKEFTERSIGKLNSSFKNQVGPEYANILTEMAEDIKLKQDLDSVFKAGLDEVGNRGELAMKRIASGTTTSSDVRNLALKIKERLGIDLIKEARLRQLSMDIVGDTRGETLFDVIEKGRQGVIDAFAGKIIDLFRPSKEKTSGKIAGTGLDSNTTKNADNNTDTTAIRNTGNEKTNTNDNSNATNNTSSDSRLALEDTNMKEAKEILSKVDESNIETTSAKLAAKLGTDDTTTITAVIKQFIKEFGEGFKDKLGELLDEIADKVGARMKFIDDSGKDFSTARTNEIALIEEAKKYNNVDDFVKSQGDIVYRGGFKNNKFYTTEKNIAEDFAKNRGGTVEKYVLPRLNSIEYRDIPGVEFKDITDLDIEKIANNKGKSILDFMENDLEKSYSEAEKWAKDKGFDFIKFPTEGEIRTINGLLSTEKKLKEIYNKSK